MHVADSRAASIISLILPGLTRHRFRRPIFPTPIVFFPIAKRSMVTASSSSSSSSDPNTQGAFSTIEGRHTCEKEIKKSKFIAIAGHVSDQLQAESFLSEVSDPRATHNCWAYKVGDQYRCNDDGEPSSTAGKPIYSAILSSGLDRVIVVVTRYFGGIKLGTGGLVRAYGGIAMECLRNAPTRLVKSKVIEVEKAAAKLAENNNPKSTA